MCQVSTGWLSQHSMADDNKKLKPHTRFRPYVMLERGLWSIGGGSPLLNWMPLDWLQEDLSTPPKIGFRWGIVRGWGDVLPDYWVRQRARVERRGRQSVTRRRINQSVVVRAGTPPFMLRLPTGCFCFLLTKICILCSMLSYTRETGNSLNWYQPNKCVRSSIRRLYFA